jgi:DNA-binding response OmpR family regulator
VLVVDDSPEILSAVRQFLGQHGLNVIMADSPLGVSSLVLRQRPAVIVLDVMMPALDGGALAKLLRSVGGGETVPIVFFSSMEEEQLYELARQTEGATYVLKSDGLPALHAAICRRLSVSLTEPAALAPGPRR